MLLFLNDFFPRIIAQNHALEARQSKLRTQQTYNPLPAVEMNIGQTYLMFQAHHRNMKAAIK